MDELLSSQSTAIALLLGAVALLINAITRAIVAAGAHIGPIAKALVKAIEAWTRRTVEERDCAPQLAQMRLEIAALKRLLAAAASENTGLRKLLHIAGVNVDDIPIAMIEARDDEPTGDQRLPRGVAPSKKEKHR